MKKIVVAMYDEEGYTRRLADYFCQHQKNLFDVRLFTSEESLRKFILWIHCTLSGVGWATNAERKNYRCSLKIGETYRCRSACSRAGSKISVPAI